MQTRKNLLRMRRSGTAFSNHEMVELRILRGGDEAKSRITALDFKTADFALCRDLLRGILWGVVHERREVQGS